jgi:hypothetical protein
MAVAGRWQSRQHVATVPPMLRRTESVLKITVRLRTGEPHISVDRSASREQAKRCLEVAARASDPVLKAHLKDAAQRWTRIASDIAATSELLDNCENKLGAVAG